MANAIAAAQAVSLGKPLSAEEAEMWSIRAAGTIRKLGLTSTKVYDLSRNVSALTMLSKTGSDAPRVAAVAALAVIKSADAQNAIAVLACDADAPESVRLSAFSALTESLRRFKNMLSDASVKSVKSVVTGPEGTTMRDAAAQSLGAMNLQSQEVKGLILDAE